MSDSYQGYFAVGNLGRDPEIRSTASGKKVANFSIAIEEGFGDNKKTEWVNCVAWEKLADLSERFLKKGKKIGITGKLQTTSWDDKQTGKKVYKTEVRVSDLQFMDGPRAAQTEGRQSTPPAPRQQAVAPPRAVETDPFSDTEISDDDIPF